jgi:homoserine dehydrogenase
VLAAVAASFGNHDVSIGSVIQKPAEGGAAQIVCVTHLAREKDVRTALEEIGALDVVSRIASVIRVEEL